MFGIRIFPQTWTGPICGQCNKRHGVREWKHPDALGLVFGSKKCMSLYMRSRAPKKSRKIRSAVKHTMITKSTGGAIMSQLYLHEAIGKALEQLPNKTGTTAQIRDIIERDGTYLRGDGFAPPTSQISARVKNYGQYFERVSGGIKLIRPVR